VAVRFDDHSAGFAALRRDLRDSNGVRLMDFVRDLKPDFRKVRRDIALGYLMLAVTIAATAFLPWLGVPALLAAALGAISVGYWVAYLQLFIHEGAHYNLTADRAYNDRFCDLAISWMVGTSIAAYRPFHFQHHRALGMTNDSEHSYFFPLNLVFFTKSLFGARALEVIALRHSNSQNTPGRSRNRALWIAPLAHGALILAALAVGYWWLAAAWLFGVGAVYPFLGALRQFLEHRDEDASPSVDYSKVDHGAVTRIFQDGPFSSTFGGAGFNRHLLHHWEPQVSYTRLADFERFLLDTPLAEVIEKRRTTYAETFLKLLSI